MSGATRKAPRISAYLAPDTTPTTYVCRRLRIPAHLNFLAAVGDVLAYLTREASWEDGAALSALDASCLMAAMLDEFYEDGCMIGAIFPYITEEPPPHCLPCDGTIYDAADYPQLYERLDSALKLPNDQFRVPDLHDRFVLCSGAEHTFMATGGAETVTLTVDQIPAHSHTTQPHAHTESVAAPSFTTIGLEPPDPMAIPGTGTTGQATVLVDDTGGGQAHENMPPYVALRYCVVAE